jgi:SAM-dependent methyltransferase
MMTGLQYRVLKYISSGPPDHRGEPGSFEGATKIRRMLGPELLAHIQGKTVIDFGCGGGAEALEYARHGARRVIGLDIRDDVLDIARRRAAEAQLEDVCTFATTTDTPADIIISLDSFEHFHDSAEILRIMDKLLAPEGEVIFSFGPPWYHPLGGHLFSVFPWAHLIFSEKALIQWRSTFKSDGATRFCEVAGGLNQMTIRKFKAIVAESPFQLAALEPIPIRPLAPFHNSLTREFTTAAIRGRLTKKSKSRTSGPDGPAQQFATI